MHDYCDTTPEIDGVPAASSMTMYKPYFEIIEDATSLTVYIKVPSECYYISSNAPGSPSGGSCGGPSDLHHMISIDQEVDCNNTTETVISVSLSYSEDPSGEKINIYVIDDSDARKVKGESRSMDRLH